MLEDLRETALAYSYVFIGTALLPPNPVANPTVPSVPSISTQNEPKTLIPQLVLEDRYFSHLDIGVDIGVSINLAAF